MFGSRNLLIAFCLGTLGIALIAGALAPSMSGDKIITLVIGLCLLWVSALFGPLFFMKDRGIQGNPDHRDDDR